MRTVDPASWPIHPLGTLVAFEPPAIQVEVTETYERDTFTVRLVAVGAECKRLTAGDAGRQVVLPVQIAGLKTVVLSAGGGVVLVDESAILAVLPG